MIDDYAKMELFEVPVTLSHPTKVSASWWSITELAKLGCQIIEDWLYKLSPCQLCIQQAL